MQGPAVWRLGQLARALLLPLAGALVVGTTAAQTIYRIEGADGRITYSDSPAAAVGKTTVTEGGRPTATEASQPLPTSLRQPAERHPVTLFTTSSCAPCAAGRSLLVSRGVPFKEKTITSAEDSEALLALSGETALPLLTVGDQKVKGWSQLQWQSALDAAGYPERSQLPPTYRWLPGTPLAVRPDGQISAPATPSQSALPAPVPAPTPRPSPATTDPSNPTGIKF